MRTNKLSIRCKKRVKNKKLKGSINKKFTMEISSKRNYCEKLQNNRSNMQVKRFWGGKQIHK